MGRFRSAGAGTYRKILTAESLSFSRGCASFQPAIPGSAGAHGYDRLSPSQRKIPGALPRGKTAERTPGAHPSEISVTAFFVASLMLSKRFPSISDGSAMKEPPQAMTEGHFR